MKRLLFLCAGTLLPVSAALAQTIVYDNTAHSLNNNQPLLTAALNDSAEGGDEITLAGTDREIVQLSLLFFYRGTLPGTMDARIRFLAIDDEGPRPGTVLYSSDIIQGLTTVAGMNEYVFDIPHIVVPDTFAWTIQLFNRQGSAGELGPAYFNAPTVGSSDDFFWLADSGTEWINYSWGGDPYANFGARVMAVPEPATLLTLAGAMGLFLRKRRNKGA